MSKEKCTEDFIANAVKLMNSGAQGKDIALALGVRASTLSTWLNHPKTDNQKKLSEAMKKAEVNRTTAMINAVMKAGMTKDWKAAAWWLERNKPMEYSLSNARMQRLIEQHEAENPRPVLDTAQLVPPAYWDVWRDIMQGGHSTYEARGGRGGLKTSMFSLASVMLMLNDPKMCGVGFRQVSATIRDSIMAAFISSIRRLGVEHDFTWTFNPMEITRKSTGQVIMFRGLDDPEKTKSLQLRDPDMYIGFAVWEEFNQFKGMAPVRKAEQTVKRGAAPLFRTFRMWNTHPDCEHWSNAHFEESLEDPDTYALQVNYDQVPPEWLGEGFLRDAEKLKATNLEAYMNEYQGKTTKLTGRVFGNVEDRELAPGEERGFKWVRNGIDWGFMQDPFVFLRVAYDRKADEIFIFDEIYNTEVLDAPNIAEVRRRLAGRAGHAAQQARERDPRRCRGTEGHSHVGERRHANHRGLQANTRCRRHPVAAQAPPHMHRPQALPVGMGGVHSVPRHGGRGRPLPGLPRQGQPRDRCRALRGLRPDKRPEPVGGTK